MYPEQQGSEGGAGPSVGGDRGPGLGPDAGPRPITPFHTPQLRKMLGPVGEGGDLDTPESRLPTPSSVKSQDDQG